MKPSHFPGEEIVRGIEWFSQGHLCMFSGRTGSEGGGGRAPGDFCEAGTPVRGRKFREKEAGVTDVLV